MDKERHGQARSPSDHAQQAAFLSALLVALAQAVALPCFASKSLAQDSAAPSSVVPGLAYRRTDAHTTNLRRVPMFLGGGVVATDVLGASWY